MKLELRRQYREAQERLSWGNSYSRLPMLLDLALDFRVFTHVLGDLWTGFDNIGAHYDEIVELIDYGQFTIPEMMTGAERRALRDLPDSVTIYRGCHESNALGLSWSLDRNTAAKFPLFHRYRSRSGERPILIEARIGREAIVALKLNRREREVICVEPEIVSKEFLDAGVEVAA